MNGAVGNVVVSTWKDVNTIRKKGVRRNTTLTEAQLVHKAKFTLAGTFIKNMKNILEITFKSKAKSMSGQNAALSDLYKYAITGLYPNFTIDFSKVKISADSGIPNGTTPAAVSNAPGKIHFTWVDNSGTSGAQMKDKALVVAYCESMQQVIYKTAAAERSDIATDLDADDFSGLPVHTWIAFISENGKKVSESRYTGLVNVQ